LLGRVAVTYVDPELISNQCR